jgi:twitching motility protein PilT
VSLDQRKFLRLLKTAVKHDASDIHLRPGLTPAFRIHGRLMEVNTDPLSENDIHDICSYMMEGGTSPEKLKELKDFDGSFDVPGLSRFRYNVFRHGNRLGVTLRVIPSQIATIDSLELPEVLKKISLIERGLILVTGATGSGKSSTLAAMVDWINTHRHQHIVTIEDPIEYVHQNRKSRITQRELGKDTDSFAKALRSALRQDPDVILVGEMRDADTIETALKAAETGHVVFSTVHTPDAAKTIGRLISIFPPEEQRVVRIRLADNLKATVSQRLLRRSDKKGRVPAQEILLNNQAIQECIIDPALTSRIPEYIAKGKDASRSQTFEQHLVELYTNKKISLETAKAGSSNPDDFERNLMYGANDTGSYHEAGSEESVPEGFKPEQIDTTGLQMDFQEENEDSKTDEAKSASIQVTKNDFEGYAQKSTSVTVPRVKNQTSATQKKKKVV